MVAYPRRPRGEDPNGENVETSVETPAVAKVVAPSATGGAPPLAETSKERNYRPVWLSGKVEDNGSIYVAPPPDKSIDDFSKENAEAVAALAERLRERVRAMESEGQPLDAFWSGVALSPEAAAASVLRRVAYARNMQGLSDEDRQRFFNPEVAKFVQSHPLYRYMRWVGGTNG